MPKEKRLPHGTTIRRSVAVAFLLHVIVGFALSSLPLVRPMPAPRDEVVAVELLPPRAMKAPTPSVAADPGDAHASARSTPPAKEGSGPASALSAQSETAVVRATEFFAARTLADPRSRAAREALQQLATGERIVQLCNVEAMEQVHRWDADFQPDFLVAYAMADPVLSGRVLRAEGGAFRSRRNWYNIRFKCEIAPDMAKVVAFEFSVGSAIPREEWEAHALSADDQATE